MHVFRNVINTYKYYVSRKYVFIVIDNNVPGD